MAPGGGRPLAQMAFAGVLVALMAGVGTLSPGVALFEPARLSLNYGFLLLVAYLAGDLFKRVGLPRISGYIAAGIVSGPFVLGFIDAAQVKEMKFIDDLALSFIALTAGSELRLSVLKARRRTIGLLIATITLVVSLGVAGVTIALGGSLPFLAGFGPVQLAVAGALVGVIAVARSPTSAIALIEECRARGRFTDTVFGVTVAMDSLVILLFALVVSVGVAAVRTGGGMDTLFVAVVLLQLLLSIGLGAVVGLGVSHYIRRVDKDLSVVLVVLAFLITVGSRWVSHLLEARFQLGFHLEPLLIATAAGFTVTNFTDGGERLSEGLHAISLPVFVVFFAMAGAGLNLGALTQTWVAAVGFAVVRMALISGAAYAGCALAGEEPRFRRLCGFSFYTQAGVSLGLTQELVRRFPEWGGTLGTLLVACITLNEIVGPVAFKYALDRIGDSGREP